MKTLLYKQSTLQRHWVGDAFPVRTIFSYSDIDKDISPFILMDYAGPENFTSSPHHIRGVGEHPHRGFETVTIVYDGEVEHRDSAGGGGIIGPGDVQWMTAASGLVHEEKHTKDFSRKGGRFEMIQLWVNLPAKSKMAKPRYQGIKDNQIPKLSLPNEAGTLRVIAGQYQSAIGPAQTFTPVNLWDIRLKAKKSIELTVPVGHTTLLFVLEGEITLESGEVITEAELAALDRKSDRLSFMANRDAKILFLGGEPLNEPVVGYGPFVMNSKAEIQQAISDFNKGLMGSIGPIENA